MLQRVATPLLFAACLLIRLPAPVLADGDVHVKPGDTLTAIALAHYGDARYAAAIAAYNGLASTEKITSGQVLRLPDRAALNAAVTPASGSSAETVRVRPGDTLSSLALSRYGDAARAAAIAAANGLRDPSHIEAGQTLVLPPDPGAKRPVPLAQAGVATWYGPGFEGKITKCGQVYHQWDLSAASNDLPCGALVEVTNDRNDQAVVVPITDTGAFRHPDILDLSRGAFATLAATATGVIPIHLKVRSLPFASR